MFMLIGHPKAKRRLIETVYIHNCVTGFAFSLTRVKLKLRFSFKTFLKLSSVSLMKLFQNDYYGCQEEVAKKEAFTGTGQSMIDTTKNELTQPANYVRYVFFRHFLVTKKHN